MINCCHWKEETHFLHLTFFLAVLQLEILISFENVLLFLHCFSCCRQSIFLKLVQRFELVPEHFYGDNFLNLTVLTRKCFNVCFNYQIANAALLYQRWEFRFLQGLLQERKLLLLTHVQIREWFRTELLKHDISEVWVQCVSRDSVALRQKSRNDVP